MCKLSSLLVAVFIISFQPCWCQSPTRTPSASPTSPSPITSPPVTTGPTVEQRFPTFGPTGEIETFPPTTGVNLPPKPTKKPTREPTLRPTKLPTQKPSKQPTSPPTKRRPSKPTRQPTRYPTSRPTAAPTDIPLQKQWLTAHNIRRENFFAKYGLGPKPLKWSLSLARSAQKDALALLNSTCQRSGLAANNYGGQNLLSFYGINRPDMRFKSPEEVLTNFYDAQRALPFGLNEQFLQVIWRSTKYVGCERARSTYDAGPNRTGRCFVHVCRYISRSGCKATRANYLSLALNDTATCRPICPTEGCY